MFFPAECNHMIGCFGEMFPDCEWRRFILFSLCLHCYFIVRFSFRSFVGVCELTLVTDLASKLNKNQIFLMFHKYSSRGSFGSGCLLLLLKSGLIFCVCFCLFVTVV